ncbi:MAG: tRNA (adenosine(37)-N6)-dimethylallyltransferase MiaA [Opitutales bacterium]|nr:tRNA (adenosine(37)-N6)-dimethylallyltransferase MiaA [Opitutales bacterium]
MSTDQGTIYVIAGVTAAGKTELALSWAEKSGAEILACDSISIYKGLDIGSAKPDQEQRNRVPHHGIDLFDISHACDVGQFSSHAFQTVDEINKRGHPILVVGGSGFYLQSFFQPVVDDIEVTQEVRDEVQSFYEKHGLPPLVERLRELNSGGLNGLDYLNPRRVTRALERCLVSGKSLVTLKAEFDAKPKPFSGFSKKVIWLDRENSDLEERIEQRTQKMLDDGLLEETARLLDQGLLENGPASNSVGYREAVACLKGTLTHQDLKLQIMSATRKLVSKQRKWFRKHLPLGSRYILEKKCAVQPDDLIWHTGS